MQPPSASAINANDKSGMTRIGESGRLEKASPIKEVSLYVMPGREL
jgi:hypothetical protein